MSGLHILGSIMGASDFSEGSGLYCTYKFETGLDKEIDWQILGGSCEGTTHVDARGVGGADTVWDQSIDVHYAVSSLVGWPRHKVKVWRRDEHGSNIFCGHGYCNCPMSPGSYDMDIVTWRPIGSFSEKLKSFFLGARPQLKNDSIISYTKGEGRFGLKSVGSGVVYVHLEVVLSGGFAQHGVVM